MCYIISFFVGVYAFFKCDFKEGTTTSAKVWDFLKATGELAGFFWVAVIFMKLITLMFEFFMF